MLSVAIDTDPTGIGWATLTANLIGCFVLGFLARDWLQPRLQPIPAHDFLGLGFCGGLTTFSTLALNIAVGVRDGHTAMVMTELALSVGLGIAAATIGIALSHSSRESTRR